MNYKEWHQEAILLEVNVDSYFKGEGYAKA